MRHPLFDSADMVQAWDWADGPDPRHKLDSLLFLSVNRSRLPGAVFFEVPEGALEDQQWRMLVKQSEPYCNCASRRVLCPSRGRSRLLPRTPPRVVEMAHHKERAALRNGLPFYNTNQPLLIAPHGGDLASAYAVFGMCFHELVGFVRPFMRTTNSEQQALCSQTGFGERRQALPQWRASLSDLEVELYAVGELQLQYNLPGPWERRLQPMCSITEIGSTPPVRGRVSRSVVTFEIDAAVRVMPYEDIPLHECKNDVPVSED